MGKVTLKIRKALEGTLRKLAADCKEGVLCFGTNEVSQEQFCKCINLAKAETRLLSCTRLDIRGIGHYSQVEHHLVKWLKSHIRLPPGRTFCNLVSPHNWLRYNINADLNILHLGIAKVDYYIILRSEYTTYFRQLAFSKPQK